MKVLGSSPFSLIFLSMTTFFIARAAPAYESSDCLKAAEQKAEVIKNDEWKDHDIAPQPTYKSFDSVEVNGRKFFRFYIEWLDHTVGGDAIIELFYDRKSCRLVDQRLIDI